MSDNKLGGIKAAIEALQGLDNENRLRIIAEIALNDPKLAAEIKGQLFSFEDIASLTAKDFNKVKQKANAKTFYIALRKISDDFKEKLKCIVSTRAYEMIFDEVSAVGPQKVSVVKESQQEIIQLTKDMADKGEIALPSKWSNSDEYVA